ncbi:MAG: S24/S26 family peptidase [Anaerolineae bacterium]|nr:S24/S26 family peptidase [Anaerolineae bacterium]
MAMQFSDQWPDILAETATNAYRLHVRGRSMWPTLQPGDEVYVEKIEAQALHPGDWVVIRAPSGPLVHRFLKFTRDGGMLTKGDAHRAPDPRWPQEALLGRVTTVIRHGNTLPVRTNSLRERIKTMFHQIIAGIWQKWRARRRGASHLLLLIVLWLSLASQPLLAAVTLSDFGALAQTADIKVYWETASEVNMSVFYVLRASSEAGTYDRVSNYIPAEGDFGGAIYEYIDEDVEAGTTYYYKLEAVETNGSSEFHGPISARIPLPGENNTPTPSPTPTLTPTPTPTPTPTTPPPTTQPGQPTATLEPYVRFWADQTTVQAGQCVTLQWETREISTVFLDGIGVPGVSGKTVCPCENQTYTLRVTYRNGSTEDFTVTLNVQGVCTPAPLGSTATPTFPPPATLTPLPNETPPPTVENVPPTPTPTLQPQAPTRTPLPQTEPAEPTENGGITPEPLTMAPETEPTTATAATPTLIRPALGGQDAPTPGWPSSSGWLWAGIGAGGLLILLGGAGIWWMRKRS